MGENLKANFVLLSLANFQLPSYKVTSAKWRNGVIEVQLIILAPVTLFKYLNGAKLKVRLWKCLVFTMPCTITVTHLLAVIRHHIGRRNEML